MGMNKRNVNFLIDQLAGNTGEEVENARAAVKKHQELYEGGIIKKKNPLNSDWSANGPWSVANSVLVHSALLKAEQAKRDRLKKRWRRRIHA